MRGVFAYLKLLKTADKAQHYAQSKNNEENPVKNLSVLSFGNRIFISGKSYCDYHCYVAEKSDYI